MNARKCGEVSKPPAAAISAEYRTNRTVKTSVSSNAIKLSPSISISFYIVVTVTKRSPLEMAGDASGIVISCHSDGGGRVPSGCLRYSLIRSISAKAMLKRNIRRCDLNAWRLLPMRESPSTSTVLAADDSSPNEIYFTILNARLVILP